MCLVGLIFAGTVSAENNTTAGNATMPPLTMESAPSEEITPYRFTEQYQTDVEREYQYYKSIQDSEIVQNLRSLIYNYLVDSSLSWENKQKIILPLMGWDFRLEYYMSDKCTVDEATGNCTYDLGIGNWFARLFGAGIDDALLPQNIAEGDALYRIYSENYVNYVQALCDGGIR